jgi:recombination protein RecT
VFDGELISRNRFTGEMKFDPDGKKSEKVLGYLLYFKLLNGFEKHYYMTHEEAEAHGKRYSQSYKKGYGVWADNFEAMAHKTVTKLGLSKFGVLSVEMAKAFEADQSVVDESGAPAAYPDAVPAGDVTSEAAPSVDQQAPSDASASGEIAGEGEQF